MLKKRLLIILSILLLTQYSLGIGRAATLLPSYPLDVSTINTISDNGVPLHCVAFSPSVDGYDAEFGPYPPSTLIDQLLNIVIHQLGFRCIMTYGVLNGLDYIFEAAQNRGVKVIAIIWLDDNITVNNQSIALGIQKAKQYPTTIIRLSCGSEVQTRRGAAVAIPIIQNCINQFKAAGVTQPMTSIDTWWVWCNESLVCQQRSVASQVDWIGVNVYPWWENKYSGLYPCTTATQAADFHRARLAEIIARYPGKEVILTEFGWRAGPDGHRETNQHTGQQCGVANAVNQKQVIWETVVKLIQSGRSYVMFEAFREAWKARREQVEPYWGICQGSPPYTCRFKANPTAAEMILGLGAGGQGWSDAHNDATANYGHLAWLQLPWPTYNSTNGETRPGLGNVDSDGGHEIILGLGSGGGGWVYLREGAAGSFGPKAWIQVPWSAYNSVNGETRPTHGNLDIDHESEIILGLGAGGDGWIEVREGATQSYAHKAWIQVPWPTYNNMNGETRPAAGDLDGAGQDEIVIGFGSKGSGWIEVRSNAASDYAHLLWKQVNWSQYNSAYGGTRPAVGDIDGDGKDEIVVGLDSGSSGWFEILDDAAHSYTHLAWVQVQWSSYNSTNGETRPALGDIDGDGRDEIMIGLGAGSQGWYEIFDDATTNYAHVAWQQVDWSGYNSVNGEIWPSIGEIGANGVVAHTVTPVNSGQDETKTHKEEQNSPDAPLSASLMIGPPTTAVYYPDPVAVTIDLSNAPPNSTINYAGPPSDGPYYPGPESSDSGGQSLKVYLPIVNS